MIERHKKNIILFSICAGLITVTLLIVWLFNKDVNDENVYELSPNAFLRNYGINEIVPITITDEQMARRYLAEYVQIIMNNPEKAYAMLADDYRVIAFPTYESFMEYIEVILNEKFFSATLEAYNISAHPDGYRVYNILDAVGNNFIFRETSIMNYTVLLDNYTI